jgi:acyl-CoA dehydrogenase
VTAPHPIAEIRLSNCRVAAAQRLGEEGDGMRLALGTLDFFRTSVGAAACGLARRALLESRAHVRSRKQFGSALAEFQLTQASLAEMATDLDAARLLVYRAAWTKDNGAERLTSQSAMAKLFATEAAQRIVDRAVQLHGGRGVERGTVVERLYREVRAPRIYEGTSEIQRLVIARELLDQLPASSSQLPASSSRLPAAGS